MDYTKFYKPIQLAHAFRHRFWFWVARQLQFYLAHTPVIWGDAGRVRIGNNVTLADTVLNCRSGRIVIEDDVFFGHHVLLLAGKHDYRRKGLDRKRAVPQSGHDIIIRRGAWVASGVIVMGPCEIGEHAVIVAGSVIRGNVPAGMLFGGNPPRPIRQIPFDAPA